MTFPVIHEIKPYPADQLISIFSLHIPKATISNKPYRKQPKISAAERLLLGFPEKLRAERKNPSMHSYRYYLIAILLYAPLVLSASPTTFDLMQIEQVIGGINGDVTAQAIQLRMRTGGQTLVSGARLQAWDKTGLIPVLIIDFTTNVAKGGTGKRILVASANFPAVNPDFIMTNPIPMSYLAAGSLTFEDDIGTVYWRISWGGASYTGPTTGSATNDDNGDFGPPFGSALPSTDTRALLFQGMAGDKSTNNLADYALTVGDAVFTNNAGETSTVSRVEEIVEAEIPIRFELEQNYPNPFNPNTTIEFALRQSAFTTLTVYNVVGEEIAILVNEKLGPGSYKTSFNAPGLASGVYFYRLQAGEFVETKTLILVK